VVITFTLCTVRDTASSLAEVRRVLRPDGKVVFAEHGRGPELGVARWQGLRPYGSELEVAAISIASRTTLSDRLAFGSFLWKLGISRVPGQCHLYTRVARALTDMDETPIFGRIPMNAISFVSTSVLIGLFATFTMDRAEGIDGI
jgi:SAM-dependent methyltransferase